VLLTLQELGKPVYAEFTFQMADSFDYSAFFGDSAKVEAFKTDMKGQMAPRLGIPATAITITNIYKGSIVVELTIDTNGLAQNQLQDIVGLISYQPASLFDPVWLSSKGITGVSAKVTQSPPSKINIPAIVGGVVGGVGGAAVIGGTTWFILKKR
jgi:hypothetical protein